MVTRRELLRDSFGKLKWLEKKKQKVQQEPVPWYAQDPREREKKEQYRRTHVQADLLRQSKCLQDVKEVHSRIVEDGLEDNRYLRNLLVEQYGKFGYMEGARSMFAATVRRNTFSWNIMIAAFALNGQNRDALNAFREMDLEGVKPSEFTFSSLLGVCSSLGALAEAKAIHECVASGEVCADEVLWSALITMYRKLGKLGDGRSVFDSLPKTVRNVVSWTTIIAAYAAHGQGKEALDLYRRMDLEGVKQERVTFMQLLVAFAGHPTLLAEGKMIHRRIIEVGLEGDLYLSTALINMYSRCGSLEDARAVFDEISEKDTVAWTAMIIETLQHGEAKEALTLYKLMEQENVKACDVTFVGALDACASLGDLAQGRKIHEQMIAAANHVKPNHNAKLDTALVTMYSKCGRLNEAMQVFQKMSSRDDASWNAVIGAYAQNGHLKQVIELLRRMDLDGMRPNEVTTLHVLFACSHAGLVAKAREYFWSISADRGLGYILEHYGCMVDLLARGGQLKDAEDLLENMPFQPSSVAWGSLLSACREHNDIDRAEFVAEHVFQLDWVDSGLFVILSNIYSSAGRWDDVERVRRVMEDRGVAASIPCNVAG